MLILRRLQISIVVAIVALSGCTSVPPQVIQVQLQEKTIIESLRKSHLALVDVYMEKKLEDFEDFFFSEHSSRFRENWMKGFLQEKGRQYDPQQDFSLFYKDLVAEYQEKSELIARLHSELRQSIVMEYRNALDAHSAVSQWLVALKDLNESQRNTFDSILNSLRSELSLDAVENNIREVQTQLTLPQNTR